MEVALISRDIAQHQEKGMKAQLVVGNSKVDFPSIPGISAPNYPDSYESEISWSTIGSSLGAGIIGLALAIVGLGRTGKREPEDTQSGRTAIPATETRQRKKGLFGRK